ncbi:MAG: hypothetical protein ACLR1G_13305 [Alistipes indistinctus]
MECFGDFRHDMQTPASDEKKVLKIAKLLLVVLFVSYYCESSLFYHTHYFSWGVVTHSHPYLPAGSGTRAITIRPSSATRSHSSRCCCSLQASLWFRFSSPALRLDSGLPYGTAASLLPYRSRS